MRTSMSGGERQRAWIAMTIAQEPEILILDEPTTYLDVSYQVEVLELVKKLNRELGITIIMVLHDINLAARYADTILLMKDGGIVASGAPADVLTGERIASVYGLPMRAFHAADNPQVSLWFPDTTEEGAVFPSRSGIFQEEDMEQ